MLKKLVRTLRRISGLHNRVVLIQEALGRIETRQVLAQNVSPTQSEFRVFSQWGEDGIIQHLIHSVPISKPIFVEFGVEDYTQSNTRFLLTNDNWSGLVIDGSAEHIDFIKKDPIYWACNLKAEYAFVTAENINNLLLDNGISGDIGILSVDIDGNDYWVWKSIDVISPRIVICEYCSQFGPSAKVTIPYDPSFVRDNAHFSKIYYGASISALSSLAASKGYSLVAANTAGNNLFFVRNDLIGALPILSPVEAYKQARFRECHNEQGKLTFEDFDQRSNVISNMPLYDLDRNTLTTVQLALGKEFVK